MTETQARSSTFGIVMLLGTITAFAPMSIDMYLPAFPAIGRDLQTTPQAVQTSLAIFFAGLAFGQFFVGPASDRFGRRLPVLIGISVYVASSIACALAPTIEVLWAARVAQALGGCAGAVVSRAVVRDLFSSQEMARVLSLMTLVMGMAPILAPMLGSVVLSLAGWRAIFWCLALFGTVVGLAVIFLLKETRSPETAAQARAENPFQAYGILLKNPRLMGYLLAGALNSACLFAYVSSSADLFITTYGISPGQFGLYFGVNAVGLIGAGQVNRHLLRYHSLDRILSVASLVTLVVGVLMMITTATGFGGFWGVFLPIFALMTTFGFMQSNTAAGALTIDPLRAGSVAAMLGGSAFGVGAVSSALAGMMHDGSAKPMALIILVSVFGSAWALYGLALPKPAR
jgi:DHA1 family bicyclomycin/chloramphenicol resistance-like MFS transporter